MTFVYPDRNGILFSFASNSLFERLEGHGNELNLPIKHSLQALLLAFEEGLGGKLPSKFFLSSIHPGIGKTEAISSFLRSWKNRGFLPDGSVLVGLRTKDEIRSLVIRLGLDDEDYACLTRDDAVNSLGRGDGRQTEARILLTTQQMIISRTKDRSFNAASAFFYEGKPRPLRLWDESIVLAEPVTIPLYNLQAAIGWLRTADNALAEYLRALVEPLMHDDAPSIVAIDPVMADRVRPVLTLLRGHSSVVAMQTAATLEALLSVAGQQMRLFSGSGKVNRALVGSTASLPLDFAPAIITDASGSVRGTYDVWEEAVGNLVRLPTVTNDYQNMSLHVWRAPSGKKKLRDPGIRRIILSKIADAVAERPDERWLAISNKTEADLNIEVDLRETLPNGTKLEYLTWGKHHGTNNYADVRNVIVIGSFLYNDASYEALDIAAAGGRLMERDAEHKRFIKQSEYQHNMLQAVMRGHARRAKSGIAGECQVYVVASSTLPAQRLLRETFLGCQIVDWSPATIEMTARQKRLADWLESEFRSPSLLKVAKGRAIEGIGINRRSLRDLTGGALFEEFLQRIGVAMDYRYFYRL